VLARHGQKRRLRRRRLGLDRPPHDPDEIEDRELEDEHQEDDLDHNSILGGFGGTLLVAGVRCSF
jgi:hypothetical protein